LRRNLKVGGGEFQDFRGRVSCFLAEKTQDAKRENGRELVEALFGRQIALRIKWRIGPRFGHDATETKE
jgi:hypothetical protein